MWEVELTDECEQWWEGLSEYEQELLDQRIKLLEAQGPGLGRPAVDTLTGSKIANLKELRASTLRVLFVFDPRRTAVLLLGGDKRGDWRGWYVEAIPLAESIYQRHLDELGEGGRK